MGQFDDFDHEKQKVLVALAEGCTIKEAAARGGVTRQTTWNWRKADPLFQAAWDVADDMGITDGLEEALTCCAKKAIEDPRYQPSLFCSLRARRAGKYTESHNVNHSGKIDSDHRIAIAAQDAILGKMVGSAERETDGDPETEAKVIGGLDQRTGGVEGGVSGTHPGSVPVVD